LEFIEDKNSNVNKESIKIQQPFLKNEELNITLKIIIADPDFDSRWNKNMKKILSPILSRLELLPKIGIFHRFFFFNF
jgi:hypothetical protein